MYKELKRRVISRLIELIINNNNAQTTLSWISVESYIDAVMSIFGHASIEVFRDLPLSLSKGFIIYTKVRLYYSEDGRYFYYEWKIGQTDCEVHVDTGDCL